MKDLGWLWNNKNYGEKIFQKIKIFENFTPFFYNFVKEEWFFIATISFFRTLEFKIDGLIKALENDRKPNLTDIYYWWTRNKRIVRV